MYVHTSGIMQVSGMYSYLTWGTVSRRLHIYVAPAIHNSMKVGM